METAAQGIFAKAPIIIVIGSYSRAAKELPGMSRCEAWTCSLDYLVKRKPNLITKTEVARRLHEMVHERLFGNKPWPVEKESKEAVHTTLLELGLVEYVPLARQRCHSFARSWMGQASHSVDMDLRATPAKVLTDEELIAIAAGGQKAK